MYIDWPIFMRLAHICICVYMCIYIHIQRCSRNCPLGSGRTAGEEQVSRSRESSSYWSGEPGRRERLLNVATAPQWPVGGGVWALIARPLAGVRGVRLVWPGLGLGVIALGGTDGGVRGVLNPAGLARPARPSISHSVYKQAYSIGMWYFSFFILHLCLVNMLIQRNRFFCQRQSTRLPPSQPFLSIWNYLHKSRI